MSKHTKGPWRLSHDSGYFVETAHDDAESAGVVAELRVPQVKRTEDDDCELEDVYREHDEVQANARLIAAAPELLDFAKWYLHYCEEHDDDQRDNMPRYESVKSLIAKAEGK